MAEVEKKSDGAAKHIGTIINLVILVFILIGAWIGYKKYIAAPKERIDKTGAAVDLASRGKYQAALAELEKIDDEDLNDFVKEQRFLCYTRLAMEAEKTAMESQQEAREATRRHDKLIRRRDDVPDSKMDEFNERVAQYEAKAAHYAEKTEKAYRAVLDYLEKAEKNGTLTRAQIASRSGAYLSLGDKAEAKKWQEELRNRKK